MNAEYVSKFDDNNTKEKYYENYKFLDGITEKEVRLCYEKFMSTYRKMITLDDNSFVIIKFK